MIEQASTIGVAAVAAYLSKDGVAKLLGPTADYLGGELKHLVEKSQRNLVSVFVKAERKSKEKLEGPGAVNSRVFKHVYDDARFCENELLAEYFGGVLASARTKDGQDDRGVYYAQIVKSLSVYQLQCHYLFYYLMWQLGKGRSLDLNGYEDREKLSVVVPVKVYEDTFNVSPSPKENSVIAHVLSGLGRSDLIGEDFELSSPDALKSKGVLVDSHAFVITPTITGIELFLWAHGKGEERLSAFLDHELISKPDLDVKSQQLVLIKNG